MNKMNAYYTALKLTPGASNAEIRHAYKKMLKRYHPDHVPPQYRQQAAARLQQVIAAYKALTNETPKNPARRALNVKRQSLKAGNDNPAPAWRTKARTGFENIAEIFWPLAPKEKN